MLLLLLLVSSLLCVVLCVMKMVMLDTTAKLISILTTFGALVGAVFVVAFTGGEQWIFVAFLMLFLWVLFWLCPLVFYLKAFNKRGRPSYNACMTKTDGKLSWPVSFFVQILLLDWAAAVILESRSKSQEEKDYASVFLALNPLFFIMLAITIIAVYGKFNQELTRGERRQNRRRGEEMKKIWKQKFLQVFYTLPKSSTRIMAINENTNTVIDAQNVQDANDINNSSDDDISEFLDIINDLPPDYQDVLDSDLPDYNSLKVLKMTLGQKTFILDKNLGVVHFSNAESTMSPQSFTAPWNNRYG